MNKMHLALKAKELYQIEHRSADEIAERLGISRRTVFNWMKQFDWKKPSPRPLQLRELQNAASVMLKSLDKNPDKYNNRTVSEMFKFFSYVLEEEKKQVKRQKAEKKPKSISPEALRQIEEEILGLHRN